MLILYILFCICWGAFSVYMQMKLYPSRSLIGDLILNFVANMILCPISIILAIYRYVTKTDWAENL